MSSIGRQIFTLPVIVKYASVLSHPSVQELISKCHACCEGYIQVGKNMGHKQKFTKVRMDTELWRFHPWVEILISFQIFQRIPYLSWLDRTTETHAIRGGIHCLIMWSYILVHPQTTCLSDTGCEAVDDISGIFPLKNQYFMRHALCKT